MSLIIKPAVAIRPPRRQRVDPSFRWGEKTKEAGRGMYVRVVAGGRLLEIPLVFPLWEREIRVVYRVNCV
jgi:hypothetical protein